MATAPVVILVYDYVFLSGGFGPWWRRRWGLYAGLFSIWILALAQIPYARWVRFALPLLAKLYVVAGLALIAAVSLGY